MYYHYPKEWSFIQGHFKKNNPVYRCATAHTTVHIVKGELEEAMVCRWELLKLPIFQSLVESMVDRVYSSTVGCNRGKWLVYEILVE